MVWGPWTFLWQFVLTSLLFTSAVLPEEEHCSRHHSRLVRNVLREHFYPIYEGNNVEVPKSCLLHESHDVYIHQEINKNEEHSSRWTCNLCGKAFYSEEYMDLHFENRHKDHMVKDSPVCLADYCDVFRCDILDDHRRERFWEKALCKHEKMASLKRRCEVLIHGCLPIGNITSEMKYKVYGSVWMSICSLLTCKDYWKPPYDETPTWKVILYAVFSPFFVMALIVYYYCSWEYYYGDLFQDSSSEMEEHSSKYVQSWQGAGQLRQRQRNRMGRVHMY